MADPIIRGWKEYTEDGRQYRIRAQGGLHWIRGNRQPYFSLTGEIQRGLGGGTKQRTPEGLWREYSCGCLHEELLKHWPELEPLTLLHLSDMDGVPSHGSANAWYWMAGALSGLTPHHLCQYHGASGDYAKTPQQCLDIFAKHVRISLAEATGLRDDLHRQVMALSYYDRVWVRGSIEAKLRPVLTSWCEAQHLRWKGQAVDAIRKFDLQVFGTRDNVPAEIQEQLAQIKRG